MNGAAVPRVQVLHSATVRAARLVGRPDLGTTYPSDVSDLIVPANWVVHRDAPVRELWVDVD